MRIRMSFILILLTAGVVLAGRKGQKNVKYNDPTLNNIERNKIAKGRIGRAQNPIVYDAKDCSEGQLENGKNLIEANLMTYIKDISFTNYKIEKCQSQMFLGSHRTLHLRIDVNGNSCQILLDHHMTNDKNMRVYNLAAAIEDLKDCNLYAEASNFKRNEVFGKTIQNCDKKQPPQVLKFLEYAIGKGFKQEEHEVIDCSISALEAPIMNILMKNLQTEKKTFVSIQMKGNVPEIVTIPSDFIANSIEQEIVPDLPTVPAAEFRKCPIDTYADYLEKFIDQIPTARFTAADFTVDKCEFQDIEGGIAAKLSLIDPDGMLVDLKTFFRSGEDLGTIVTDPIEYAYYLANVPGYSKDDPYMRCSVGEWEAAKDCAAFVQKFGTHLGSPNAFANKKVTDCFTRQADGTEARFKLTLKNGEVVSVHMLEPANGNGTPEFSITPSTFEDDFRLRNKQLAECNEEDKLHLSKKSEDLFGSRAAVASVVFTENIISCLKGEFSMKVTLSFDEKKCDATFNIDDGAVSSVNSGSCLKDVRVI